MSKWILTFGILKFAAAFLCLELALVLLFLYRQKVGGRRDLYFSYLCLCGSWYFVAGGMINMADTASLVILWTKLSIIGLMPIMVVYPLFIYEFVGMHLEKWTWFTILAAMLFLSLTPTNLLIGNTVQASYLLDLPFMAVRHPLYHIFVLCLGLSLGAATIRAFPHWRQDMDEPLRLIVKSQEFKAALLIALGCVLNDILGIWHIYKTFSLSAVGLSVLCIIITYRILFMQGWLYRSLNRRYVDTITALARMLDAKDGYTAGHSERVSLYADVIAEGMGLSQIEQEIIQRAALLHDIGKIAIPDSILRNPCPLKEEEWIIMKSHADKGKEILSSVEFLLPEIQIAFSHHERYDGDGYPNGLKGKDTPVGAHIIALADAFDAMTSHRAYREAMPIDEVLKEIEEHTGTQFAPAVVKVFKQRLNKILKIRDEAFARQSEKQRVQQPF